MRIIMGAGIGDEVAVTPLIRELARRNPGEMIRVQGAFFPEIFRGNPHLNRGNTESGRRFGPFEFFSNDEHGNTAYSFGLQAGVRIPDTTPEIFLSDAEVEWGRRGLEGLPRPIVAVCTGAQWHSRRWDPGRWGILCKELLDAGISVVEVGSHGADQWGWERHTKVPCLRRFTDATTVREVAAILGSCDLYAGNDSGVFHLAAAVGTRQVVLFSVKRGFCRAYRTTRAVEAEFPCDRRCWEWCSRKEGRCLDSVGWERVMEEVVKMLDDSKRKEVL